MSLAAWILAMFLTGNQWLSEGFRYHLDGPHAGWFVNETTGEKRTVAPVIAAKR